MRAPLAVRINDGYTDRHVTPHVRGLTFRKTAPGGYAAGSMRLNLPRTTFRGLGPADKVYVYDARTGRTVMEGFTENPGAADGPSGQSFDLSFLGNVILASDQSEKLIYRDQALSSWRRADNLPTLVASSTTEASEDPISAEPALRAQFNPGTPIGTGARASLIYDAFKGTTQVGSGIAVRARGGTVDANYHSDVATPSEYILHRALTTAPGSAIFFRGTDWTTGSDTFYVHLQREAGGATNVATDDVWAAFSHLAVVGSRMNRYGVDQALAVAVVTASDVVEDILGRLMTFADPTSSLVEATSSFIDQLAFPDGATAAAVLDALSLYEADMVWELLHSTERGVVFRYRAWPSEPRYEVSVRDGYTAPGGDGDLANRIAVYWADEKGNQRLTVVTSVVSELGNRTKDADAQTLPDGQGSEANAQLLGAQVLAAKAAAAKAAKVTVRRRIFDRLTGQVVSPWELEPGYLVRVRETGDVLRATEMEYADDDCAATLTLGEPTLTSEQRIARLSKKVGA